MKAHHFVFDVQKEVFYNDIWVLVYLRESTIWTTNSMSWWPPGYLFTFEVYKLWFWFLILNEYCRGTLLVHRSIFVRFSRDVNKTPKILLTDTLGLNFDCFKCLILDGIRAYVNKQIINFILKIYVIVFLIQHLLKNFPPIDRINIFFLTQVIKRAIR